MASKTNCIKNGIPYFRIRRTIGKKLNNKGLWVDDIKEFYGKNKKEAEAKYEEFKKKRHAGLSSEKQFFGIMSDFFVYSILMNDSRFSSGTKERYEEVYRNYIKPSKIAGLPLTEIFSLDLQNLYNALDCTNATLRSIHNVMKHFYKYLEKEGYCKDITASIVLPKKSTAKNKKKTGPQEVIVWSDTEIRQIVQDLGNNRIRFLIILAINTGCRISELLGLEYTDIHDSKLYITKQLQRVATITPEGKHHELKLEKTKTESSIRSIPLSSAVLVELERHKNWHTKEMLKNGYQTTFIFTTKSGNFCDRHNINRACSRYYRLIDIEDKSFHTYRHTFCTNLCKNGVPLQIAYKLMGHSNINVTAKFYTNVDDEQKLAAITTIAPLMFTEVKESQ
ncbi:site-specific integrase [Sinanaerobacter sp. ZZT-01]|uniref:tyrosine-type recombinase/integrase n=1 Tax=Sinanaerobacter sp. ZZT-01 TaxID=3111540 RepID=UPI002D76F25B|nr:site-specific integrase [Sinanaerobacter sp. ZZT-01]WRR92470.1 site-specific integrase [Sinanaerobacter sp. ZZT-01]